MFRRDGRRRVILRGRRKPIFMRPLSDAERQALEAGLRSPDAFVLRRCQILRASSRGETSYAIARTSADNAGPLARYEYASARQNTLRRCVCLVGR